MNTFFLVCVAALWIVCVADAINAFRHKKFDLVLIYVVFALCLAMVAAKLFWLVVI